MSAVFAECHARSAFSFLRGGSSPEAMVEAATAQGLSGMVLCDRDGVYGVVRAHRRAKELGLPLRIGAEITMECGCVLPALVVSLRGYQNLCRLLTLSHCGKPKSLPTQTRWADLAAHAEGLLFLSGDGREGLFSGPPRDWSRRAEQWLRMLPSHSCWVELQRHALPGQRQRVALLCELAQRHRLPVLASNAPTYATPCGREVLDAFTALRMGLSLDEAGAHLEGNDQRHVKSATEMGRCFADLPHALNASLEILQRLEFSLDQLHYEFPSHPVPQGHDQCSYLRELSWRGAIQRYGCINAEVKAQLEHELAVISKLGFSGYFLVVWSLVDWAREQGILVQGRGSAANSVVCYSLGITHADPIAYRLLFERFLSEGRESWPDIDLDLPSGVDRERLIQEVYRRFAPHGAAMTANVITHQARSTLRNMAKVLGLGDDLAQRFSALEAGGNRGLDLDWSQRLVRAGLACNHPRFAALCRLCAAVEGLPRHLGQHSGGMVLATGGLDGVVPLEPASMPGRVVVQWDKEDCADMGIIKVDLLGLGMMEVLQQTLRSAEQLGRPVDLARLPQDDEPTYELMRRADTIGVFQIESRAQMATLRRLQPRCFYDVVIEVAIVRPGPIVGRMIHPYLQRRAGLQAVDCMHPDFEPVLARTLGVPLFQEQVLRMAMIIADFSGSQAEELRRAMSFQRSSRRMQKALEKLRTAMQCRGVDAALQDRIVQSISSFALYGFPESHAISFALIAYASAWLKVHRSAEFFAALFNAQPMGFYAPATLLRDARRHGLRVLPVCVCHSALRTEPLDCATLRLGLNQLRGVRQEALVRLLELRAQEPWKSPADLRRRCAFVHANEWQALASCGALWSLGLQRREAQWQLASPLPDDDLFCAMQEAHDSQESAQSLLPPMDAVQRLAADFTHTAVSVGPHPLVHWRDRLTGVLRAADLASQPAGRRVCLAGQVICRQRPGTANGHCFLSLEDETGIANVFVPRELFERERLLWTQAVFLLVEGRVQGLRQGGTLFALSGRLLELGQEVMAGGSHDFS